jgi:hypothetical protein
LFQGRKIRGSSAISSLRGFDWRFGVHAGFFLCVNVTKVENNTTPWMASSESAWENSPCDCRRTEYRKYLAPIPPIGLLVCACVVTTLLSGCLIHVFFVCC